MTYKRALSSQMSLGNKKRRTTQDEDEDFSILQWTNSSTCWACDDRNTIEDCIQTDLSAEEYFNLAAIIINPRQLSIYPKSGKVEQLLRNSAGTLSSEEIQKVLKKIQTFIHSSTAKDVLENIDDTLEKYAFHKNREIAFVIGIINTLKKSLDSEIVRRIKENDSESIKDVLLLNPRLSRLISFLALTVREDEPLSLATSIIAEVNETAGDSNDELEYSSSFSVIDTTAAFSYSELSIENDDSHLILPVPSQPISDSQSVEHSRPSSACELFTQPSFSISDSTEIVEVPIPPPPNYDELSTDEIRAKVRSYGFKSGNRATMITYLEQLRLCARLSNSQTTSEYSNSNPNQDVDSTTTSAKVMQYIRSQEELWMKIVEYEQIDVNELHKKMDVPCKKNELKSILDEYGVVVKKVTQAKK